MKITKKISLALIALSLLVPAAEAKKKDESAMMDEAMQEMIKRGAPSENHKVLSALVGNWDATVKFWMESGEKAEQSKASVSNELINDGRFLKQSYNGDWNGAPYIATGFTGYDNIREEYENIWLDNFSTGMMKATGQYDSKSNTLAFSCNYSCIMTGEKNKWSRSEWTILGDDKNIYKSFSKDPEGKEFLAMEITYTRAK